MGSFQREISIRNKRLAANISAEHSRKTTSEWPQSGPVIPLSSLTRDSMINIWWNKKGGPADGMIRPLRTIENARGVFLLY